MKTMLTSVVGVALFTAALLLSTNVGMADQLVVSGAAATDDVLLHSTGSYTVYNWGASSYIAAGGGTSGHRSLIRFDVASLKGRYDQITSAEVDLFLQKAITSTQAVGLFRVSNVNADWLEGRGNGSNVLPGEVDWSYRRYNTVRWAGAYGLGIATTDYHVAALDWKEVGASDAVNTKFTFSLPPALIEDWVNVTNAGLLYMQLPPFNSEVRFNSSDVVNSALHPRLTVNYAPRRPTVKTTEFSGTNLTDDVMLHPIEVYARSNWGGAIYNTINSDGGHRALIRFDVSAMRGIMPCELLSCKLRFFPSEPPHGSFTIGAYCVSDANADWVEGTGTGNNETVPGAVWIQKNRYEANWAGSYGLNTPGTDYDPVVLDQITVSTNDHIDTHYDFDLPPDLLKKWIGGVNAGLLLRTFDSNSSYFRFHAAENTVSETYSPRLIVTYGPPTGTVLLVR